MTYLAVQVIKNLIGEQRFEVNIGFIRDKSLEEQFFMVIECKNPSPMTNMKEKKLISVEDIIEIEHTEGLKFEIRYKEIKSSAKSVSGFGSQGPG